MDNAVVIVLETRTFNGYIYYIGDNSEFKQKEGERIRTKYTLHYPDVGYILNYLTKETGFQFSHGRTKIRSSPRKKNCVYKDKNNELVTKAIVQLLGSRSRTSLGREEDRDPTQDNPLTIIKRVRVSEIVSDVPETSLEKFL